MSQGFLVPHSVVQNGLFGFLRCSCLLDALSEHLALVYVSVSWVFCPRVFSGLSTLERFAGSLLLRPLSRLVELV